MNVVEFLASLSKQDIRLWLEGENLRFSAPEGAFTPEIKAEVVSRKPEIIDFLKQARRLNESPIEPVSRDKPLITSFGQQRLWILDQLNPNDITYNMCSALRIRGALQPAVLEKVFAALVKRHESLRTCFEEQDGEPVQRILPAQQWSLQKTDLSQLTESAQQETVAETVNREALTPFNLATGPLFRANLLTLSTDHHVLIAGMHHIISDGWSMEVLVKELGMLYVAFSAGMPSPLPALTIQYADYSAWQREQMSSGEMQKHLDYWKETLREAPVVLPIPTDRPREDIPTHNGALWKASMKPALAKRVQDTCTELNITPFMLLLGAWQLLLGRYAGSQDVIVGSPIAGRSRSEVQELIGFFVNLLLMRLDLSGNPDVRTLFKRVREMTLGAFSHQDLPIDKLMEDMQVERQPGYPPLAQVAFQLINLESAAQSPLGQSPVEIEAIPAEHVAARMDMVLGVAKTGDQFDLSLEYNTDLFNESTIASMVDQYLFLLQELTADLDRPINDIALYDQAHLLQQLQKDPEQYQLLELTPNQMSMYLSQLATPDTVQNTFGVYLDLPAMPDVSRLEQAIQWVVDGSPALRSELVACELPAAAPVYLLVAKRKKINLKQLDVQDDVRFADPLHEQSLRCMHRADSGLESELVRYHLLKQGNGQGERVRLVVACHHMILDGASVFLLMERILNAYQVLQQGDTLPTLSQTDSGESYDDESLTRESQAVFEFARWARNRMDSAPVLDYWQGIARQVEPLNFAVSSRYTEQENAAAANASSFNDITHTLHVDRRHLDTVKAFCQQHQINLPLYFKMLYGLMLQRMCNAESAFAIYEFYAGRNIVNGNSNWQQALGCFYQQHPTLIESSLMSPKATLLDWMQSLRQQRDSTRTQRAISLQQQYALMPTGRSVFMYNYYNFVSRIELDGRVLVPQLSTPKVDRGVQLIVKEGKDSADLELRFEKGVFHDFSFLPRLLHLSEQILFEDIEATTELNFLSAAEQMRVSDSFREVELAADQTVVSALEANAEKFAGRVALKADSGHLTYGELNARVNQLAHHLMAQGVGSGDRIGICLHRTLDLPVAVLAVLKTGAAYVPLDPAYPRDRLRFILQDCEASLLISQQGILDAFDPGSSSEDQPLNVLALDQISNALQQQSTANPGITIDPLQPFYLVYTSGSTGNPKGAIVTHDGENNLQHWYREALSLSEEDSTLLISAVGFDLTQKNLFAPLLAGASLVLPELEDYDEHRLLELIREHRISWVNCAPSAFYPLVELAAGEGYESLQSLRFVVLGGEPIRLNTLYPWLSSSRCQARLINSYGPTECTDVVAWHRLDRISPDQQMIPIGKPIANTQLHILSDNLQPQVPGCVGEIGISGQGVGPGYFNRDELTAKVFVDSALCEGIKGKGKLYRTGDLGRFLPDGTIEYIGRKDFQVKLNGLRIELGEIETALRDLPGVQDGLVMVSNERLVAYVVSEQEPGKEPDNWRELLRNRLPQYMVPSVLVTLPQWPLTPNGKIDRKALPDPAQQIEQSLVYVAPRSEEERNIVQIWQEVLQKTSVGVMDDFFAIGGNSLLATRIVSRLRKQFDIDLSVRELFLAPTVSELAVAIGRAQQVRNVPPIVAVDQQQPQPLSYAQQRLWFLDQLQPGSTAYNMPGAFYLDGVLNSQALVQTLCSIVDRHAVLRTRFDTIDDEPRQVIDPAGQWQPVSVDLTHLNDSQQEAAVRQHVDALYRHAFDLQQGPLFRIEILRLSASRHVLTVNMHHIVSDGWSNGILMRELGALYDAYSHQRQNPLPPLSVQYVDFSVWQRGWLSGDELQRQVDYWRDALAGVEVLNLPLNKPRTRDTGFAGNVLSFTLDRALTRKLNQLSREQGATLFMTLLAGYQVLLSRYTNQDDICVGSPIANRNHDAIENVIGFFVNTLALRSHLDLQAGFTELLQQVRQQTLSAYAHQDVPFERLVDELVTERDMLHSPLFQVLFSLQNIPVETDFSLPGLKLKSIANDNVVAKFDLEFSLMELNEEIKGEVVYRTELFDRQFIEQLMDHYRRILQAVVDAPNQPLQQLSFISAEEVQVLHRFNDTGKAYPRDLCVHQWFEQQAQRTPDACAVLCGDRQLSYAQLDQRSNQLARLLQEQGIKPGGVVAVMLPRNALHLMSGLLGILKAGATYLPLDPSYPQDRIEYMLSDSAAGYLLALEEYRERLSPLSTTILYLDALESEMAKRDSAPLTVQANQSDAERLLYIIYTSGSTGMPKGTGARHRAEVNLLSWYTREYSMTQQDRVLLVSALGFDLTQKNLFAPLMVGAALVLPTVHEYDPQDLAQCIELHQVTWVNCAPNAFYPIVDEVDQLASLDSLRWVFLGGEPIDTDRLGTWLKRGTGKLVNSYGPTECADIATAHTVSREECVAGANLPIGKPIDNVRLYILDANRNMVPAGVPGELCIGGEGVGPGYFNNPEQTADKFIQNPWADSEDRIYRTGDLARYLTDGKVEYLGRIDSQVKIRGYRIEPGEIEARIRQYESVSACCVIAREDASGQKMLVAYVVSDSAQDNVLDSTSLRSFLKKTLPDFMVPSYFVAMDALPLTPNGKVARKQLPEPEVAAAQDREIIAPETETEQQVLAIWKAVLKNDSISVEDDFFVAGGHSLLATQVVSRLRKQFRIQIPLRALFESPTVRTTARLIDTELTKASGLQRPAIEKVVRGGALPLSFVQQQLWLLDQLDPGTPAYNMPVSLRIKGEIDTQAFKRCFDVIVQRHETLRTRFATQNGEPVAWIEPERPWNFQHLDYSDRSPATLPAELNALIEAQTGQGFDLEKDSLIRGALVTLPQREGHPQEYLFTGAIHHIVSDGWSLNIMISELTELYQADQEGRDARLPELEFQYVDLAAWQRKWLQGEVLESHLTYWREQLDNEGQVLQWAPDFPRPKVQTTRGASASTRIDRSLVKRGQALARDENTTPFTLLMSVFQLLLYRYSGQTRINVGTPIAGRDELESENLVGFFINTVVVSAEVDPANSTRQFLRQMREQLLGAYAHQALPFEKLVEELRPPRDPSRTPFFQVFLNLLNLPEPAESSSLLNVEQFEQADQQHEQHHVHAKYDLNLYVSETADHDFELHMVYNADLYRAQTMSRFLRDFVQLFEQVVADCDLVPGQYRLGDQRELDWLPQLNVPVHTQAQDSPLDLFLQHAEAGPDRVAILYQDQAYQNQAYQNQEMTYGELNRRSQALSKSLATHLHGPGVQQENVVAILAQRSPDLVVSLIAVLRAGAAFVVLDAAYPVERLQAIVQAANPVALINTLDGAELAEAVISGCVGPQGQSIPVCKSSVLEDNDAPWYELHDPGALAYLAFTSGTTGKPKGIRGTFEPVAHFIDWYRKGFELSESDTFSLLSGLAHDPLLRDVFVPLATGARIAIPGGDWLANPDTLLQWMQDNAVSVIHLTPAMAEVMTGLSESESSAVTLPHLRLAGFGGDRLSWSLVDRFQELAPQSRIANFYGATETPQVMGCFVVDAPSLDVAEPIQRSELVPLGQGIEGVQLLVLNSEQGLCAPGEAGQIAIRTPYLSLGYVSDPGDSSEAASVFQVNPHTDLIHDRIYFTGDRGRYHEDGIVEFLGRLDDQLKIRGFRIEPGDIERHLEQENGVARAVVVPGQDQRGDACLIAYVLQTESLQAEQQALDAAKLRQALRQSLPEYMVPSLFIPVQRIPLTPNGKVNKRALPDPSSYWQSREYVAPRTEVEQAIADIWQSVLKMEQVSVVDNFFDIGGHSLLAVQIVTRVKEAYQVEFSMRRLLEVASIEGMAAYVENALWVRQSEQDATSDDAGDDDLEEFEL